MKSYLSGSETLAQAVKLCRVDVMSAYPITPNTPVLSALYDLIKDGEMDTLLVSEIGIDMNNNANIEPEEWLQIIAVNGTPNDGDPIQEVSVLASQLGQIQPYHMDADYIKQYADNDLSTLEGVILAEDRKTNQQNITGTFIETPAVYTSQVQYNLNGTRTTHKLKTQGGTEEIIFEPAQKNGAFAWRTQPKAR